MKPCSTARKRPHTLADCGLVQFRERVRLRWRGHRSRRRCRRVFWIFEEVLRAIQIRFVLLVSKDICQRQQIVEKLVFQRDEGGTALCCRGVFRRAARCGAAIDGVSDAQQPVGRMPTGTGSKPAPPRALPLCFLAPIWRNRGKHIQYGQRRALHRYSRGWHWRRCGNLRVVSNPMSMLRVCGSV